MSETDELEQIVLGLIPEELETQRIDLYDDITTFSVCTKGRKICTLWIYPEFSSTTSYALGRLLPYQNDFFYADPAFPDNLIETIEKLSKGNLSKSNTGYG